MPLLDILSLLLIGMCVSRSDPNLLQAVEEDAGTAAQSPFVIAIRTARIKTLDHIVNAVVLTSAFSSGNEFLYSSSRALFMLAQAGQAPRIFATINKTGVPYVALAFTSLFALLGYLPCGAGGASEAFNWLANITTLGSMITWMGIAYSHIRFYKGMKAQGVPRTVLPFRTFLQPYAAHAVLYSFAVIALYVFSGLSGMSNY